MIFFTRHPLLDIGRTVQDRYAPRLASVEKPNTLDVDKIHFLDVQNYQCSAAVDLSLNLVQILRSQFSAEPNSRLEPFNLQGHDCRLPTLPVDPCKAGSIHKLLNIGQLLLDLILIFQEVLIFEDGSGEGGIGLGSFRRFVGL